MSISVIPSPLPRFPLLKRTGNHRYYHTPCFKMVNDVFIKTYIKYVPCIIAWASFLLIVIISINPVRFISFSTNLTMLSKWSHNTSVSFRFRLWLFMLTYFTIFEPWLLILLPNEFLINVSVKNNTFCDSLNIIKCFHVFIHRICFVSYKTMIHFLVYYIDYFSCWPFEGLLKWYFGILITLSYDVHPNPGPLIDDTSKGFNSGFITFCNWNVNTLSKDEFHRVSLIEANNTIFDYDIISLCETSLNDRVTVPENILNGYLYHPCNHPSGERKGGVGIFYKASLPLKIREDLSFGECIVTEMRFGRKKIFFTVLYRNPIQKAETPEFFDFITNFENLVLQIKSEKPYVMLFAGDFNAHSQTWWTDGDTNNEGMQLANLFYDLDLTQLISEPTHFRDQCNPSCIDLIVRDQPNLVLDSGVRPSLDPTCKHQIIFCKLNFKIPPLPSFKRHLWQFDKAESHFIEKAVLEFPWEFHLSKNKNPTSQVNMLNQTILNIMSNFVPNINVTCKPNVPKWITRDIKNLMRRQNNFYKKYKRSGFKADDKEKVDRFRDECFEAINKSKENYLIGLGNKLLDKNTGRKAYWKIVNNLLNKCKIPRIPPLIVADKFVTNCKEKANLFNNHFLLQCKPFINDSTLPNFKLITEAKLQFFEITNETIINLINELNANKAHGADQISVQMIKLCGNSICIPLCIIFNNIIDKGIFPDQWKMANVTPIHKKDNKQFIKNYRPISLLPIFAKIFERIVFHKLYNHLVSNNLITKNQSGFRPNDSVTNQLISLVEAIHSSFDCNLEVRSVYLDMSKAFDKVWHEGLLFKLRHNGVDGKLLELFKSYLANRKQRVVINGSESEWGDIDAGVPQGSVLGPLLFLIYINDLENGIKSEIKFFADDTSLFSVVRDANISADDLNHDLNLISQWAFQWKMSFNPDPKKQAVQVIFSHKVKPPNHPKIYFNNIEVLQVPEHKHLGLILDSKLSFSTHINEKIKIARKGIGVIKYHSRYLSVSTLNQIYKMYVRPHLDFCDVIFHSPCILNDFDSSINLNLMMNLLEKTQYHAALAVTGTWKGTSLNKIYEELGWESLSDRRWSRRLIQFYKIQNNYTPNYLKSPIPPLRPHLFGIRSANVVRELRCRTKRYSGSFYPHSIKIWNDIGPHLREAPSLSIFKANILKLIRPPKREMFHLHDPIGVKRIFQLRVGLSPLRSHKKKHNFRDTPSDACDCLNGYETSEHYLLKCRNFNNKRRDLMTSINPLLIAKNMQFLDDLSKVKLLLYGHETFSDIENKAIIKATITYIKDTDRF